MSVEEFATRYTDETSYVGWTLVALAGAWLLVALLRLRGDRESRMRKTVLLPSVVLVATLMLALLVPFYLESVDIRPLISLAATVQS